MIVAARVMPLDFPPSNLGVNGLVSSTGMMTADIILFYFRIGTSLKRWSRVEFSLHFVLIVPSLRDIALIVQTVVTLSEDCLNVNLGSQHLLARQSDLDGISASKTSGLEYQDLAELVSSTSMSTPKRTTHFDIPPISLLSHARISESATIVTVARHPSECRPYSDYSPYSSNAPTAVNSRAPSPTKEIDGEDDLPPVKDRLKWRLSSGFFAVFLGGWADGVTGTVIPYLSKDFHLTSTMSSSLFAGATCGFFLGTLFVESIITALSRFQLRRLKNVFKRNQPNEEDLNTHPSSSQGRHLVLLIASIAHAMYFVMMGSRSGFPVMFLAYIVSAFSRALLTAPLYAYFAEGPKQALGYGLGAASLGSVVSPLVCQLIIATGVPWYCFYYGSLVLSTFNILYLYTAFKPTSGERDREDQKSLNESRRQNLLRSGRSSPAGDREYPATSKSTLCLDPKPQSMLRLALSMPYQWALSCFALVYSGSETLTQGFMVTFLLSTRYANPKTIGYVTSGFWCGISVGRFVWGYGVPYLNYTQRKYAVQGCIAIAIVMHLLIWFLKSATQDAIYASLIGLFYGPVFPASLGMANDLLPGEVHMVAMALLSSFATLGGAIFPLMAGAIFDAKGVSNFTYVSLPVAAAMGCLWLLL